MNSADFAQHLQSLRKQAGYSQEQLAAQLGISRQAISKWESGQGKPELDKLKKLAELYHVSMDALLVGEALPAAPPQKPQKSRGAATIRRTAALILVLLAYPLSMGLTVSLRFLIVSLLQPFALRTPQDPLRAEILAELLNTLLSPGNAQPFFFFSLCLTALLLFFWDGLPRRQKKTP